MTTFKIERRRMLVVLGASTLAAAGIACSKEEKKEGGDKPKTSAANACGGATLDEQSKNFRKTLQYKEKSDNPEKHCSICAQYQPGKYADCAGCKLFSGPVNANGVCLSFAPLEEAGAPSKT